MNNIILAGRLTKETELKVTSSAIEYMQFNLAVNRSYTKQGEERKVDFIPCKAWQKTAVFINEHFNKGDGIVLSGRLESNSYVDHDGNNRTFYEVVVERVEFPQGKSQQNNNILSAPVTQPVLTQTTVPLSSFQKDLPSDDLPF
ncbi:MAG: single-stranded DNA-binding protein [Oscillospiraceae bacterium]|nr:single-stranded DNA-binding protein [Oscillospiraceae bacterium]